MQCRYTLVQMLALLLYTLELLGAVPLSATSRAPLPTDEGIIRQATTVVAGAFTGEATTVVWTDDTQFDDHGRPVVRHTVATLYSFEVTQHLEGTPMAERIQLQVVGGVHGGLETPMAVHIPDPGVRVVLGLLPETGSPEGGYNIVHGRVFPVASAAELAALRLWVQQTREAPPPDPEALLEDDWAVQQALSQLGKKEAAAEAPTDEDQPVTEKAGVEHQPPLREDGKSLHDHTPARPRKQGVAPAQTPHQALPLGNHPPAIVQERTGPRRAPDYPNAPPVEARQHAPGVRWGLAAGGVCASLIGIAALRKRLLGHRPRA